MPDSRYAVRTVFPVGGRFPKTRDRRRPGRSTPTWNSQAAATLSPDNVAVASTPGSGAPNRASNVPSGAATTQASG